MKISSIMMLSLQTRDELALVLGVPLRKLTHILYVVHPENCYRHFQIPKKSGGMRDICAPKEELGEIQQQLAGVLNFIRKEIWNREGISPNIAHAFERRKSIITNAQIHKKKRYVLNFDLEDFFGSIHFGRIVGYFEKNKHFEYSHEVAVVIAQLTCYQGSLPQGAPTSPILANMICEILDYKILSLAKKYRLDYTRYADDLTFSTNDKHIVEKYDEFCASLKKIVEKSGFRINAKKTRMQFRDSRQTVTGLVVNKKVNVDHRFYKETRAMAHKLYQTGQFTINNRTGTLDQLEGRFTFIDQLDVLNNEYRTLLEKSEDTDEDLPDKSDISRKHLARHEDQLNGREKEFRKFLFYKYFFACEKPVIITEGKTDVLYLVAAMKSLHAEYPELIKKKSDGEFELLVSFFHRSRRMDDLFDISLGGADALMNIYDFYKGTQGRPSYWNYFSGITGRRPHCPVVIVLDNEPSGPDKPLKKILSNSKISNEIREIIKTQYKGALVEGSNLFLVTHQPVPGMANSEIEDLFDAKTRKTLINGREFTPEEKYDPQKFCGKNEFSLAVRDNYETINFDNFRSLLDRINECIKEMKNNAQ